MKNRILKKDITLQGVVLFLIGFLGVLYVIYTWISSGNDKFIEVIESGVSIVLLLLSVLFLFKIKAKNKLLKSDISELNRTEDVLRVSEKLYRSLFENMLNGFSYCQMHFDDNDKPLDFTYLSVNSAFESLTGLRDVVGKKVTVVIPGIRESDPKLLEIYGRVSKSGKPELFEMFVGSLQQWFSISVYCPEQGYFVAVFDVITERKKTDESLRNSLSLMDATLEAIHNGILVVSDHGTVIKTNAKFAEMWCIPADILASGDDKTLLDSILGQLSDPAGFIARVSEIYGKPEAESLDLIDLKDGRTFKRISKPVYIEGEPKGRVWSFLDITERIQAESALKKSEESYRTLIENMGEGAGFLNDEETFVFANPTAEKIFGVDKGELIGLHLSNFLSAETLKIIESETQKRIQGKSSVYELEIVLKDGSKKDILVTATPRLDDRKFIGTLGIFRDITERKRAEVALQESEALYRNLVERLPDGVYKSTHEGRFVDVNPAMVEMLGYASKEEMLAIDIKTQLYFETADRESLVLKEELEEKGVYRLKKKDGSGIWVEDHGWYNTDENGNVLFHEGIMRDITDRKQAEEEVKLKNEELEKTNSEKDKFFSIIAHDLRSPFNGFLGLTQIMVEELSTLSREEIQEIAVSMQNSATNLFRLLENLLEWARMKQGLIPFNPKLVELVPIVDESIAMALEPAKSKGIEIDCVIPDDLKVFADSNILQMVIRNLVSNAVKFTHRGGKISVSAKATGNKDVQFSIKDTGIGMSPKIVDHLFRLDVQSNRKGTEGEPSSGLGLLLCKEFIEKHGGKIWVESDEGKGSTFYFTLPYKADPEEKIITNNVSPTEGT